MKDFYKILEVKRNAKSDEIKKSYRRLAFKYHPDTNDGSKHLESKFKQLAEAYGILSDPKERKEYDNDLKKPFRKNSNNSQQRNGPAKKQQPLSPVIFLHIMKDIKQQLANFDKSRIDKENLYDTLNQLLSDENINFLLSWDDKKTNRQIIDEVLNCCKPLGISKHPELDFIYVEQIAGKLALLAGNDKKTTQRIFKFTKQRKYRVLINEYWVFIFISFLMIVILSVIIIARFTGYSHQLK